MQIWIHNYLDQTLSDWSRPTSHDFTALHEAISASRDHCVLVTIKPAHSRKLGRVQTRCRQRRRQRPLKTNSSRRRLSLFDSLFWGGFPYTTFRVFSCFNALKTYLNSLSLHSYLRSGFVVTSLEKFVFASHLCKPKLRNKARDFPKPITSQTLLSTNCIRNMHRRTQMNTTILSWHFVYAALQLQATYSIGLMDMSVLKCT